MLFNSICNLLFNWLLIMNEISRVCYLVSQSSFNCFVDRAWSVTSITNERSDFCTVTYLMLMGNHMHIYKNWNHWNAWMRNCIILLFCVHYWQDKVFIKAKFKINLANIHIPIGRTRLYKRKFKITISNI